MWQLSFELQEQRQIFTVVQMQRLSAWCCGCTDLRRGLDGFASMVQEAFALDTFSNTLFLFCGRRRDRIKVLYWEGNGFVLLYKRLESGSFQWPRSTAEARALTPQQYRWLMEGLSVD